MEQTTLVTPEFRLAWPFLFEREKSPDGTEKGYSIVMLFDKGSNLTALKKMAWAAGKAKWPKLFTDPNAWPDIVRKPFRDGDEKAEYDGYENTWFARASSNFPVGIVDAGTIPISDPDKVYAGCYARAFVHCWAYDTSGNKGVNFGLNAIQILRDGERLGGGGVNATTVAWGALPETVTTTETDGDGW